MGATKKGKSSTKLASEKGKDKSKPSSKPGIRIYYFPLSRELIPYTRRVETIRFKSRVIIFQEVWSNKSF